MKKTTIIKNKEAYGSYFDKTIKDFIKTQIKFYLMCFGTLGFAYPWALCMKYKATYHHTVICNKRLKFIGNPNELIFAWTWWWFLSVITVRKSVG